MPRTLSAGLTAAMHAQETGDVVLVLLTIDHADLAEPIRVCSDQVDIVSRGETYIGFPFEIALPAETEDDWPQVTLSIDNVSRQITQAVRSLTSAPTIALEIIRAADPDVVEAGPFGFTLKLAEYDALVVSGTLAYEDLLSEPFPADSFDPVRFPGLFS